RLEGVCSLYEPRRATGLVEGQGAQCRGVVGVLLYEFGQAFVTLAYGAANVFDARAGKIGFVEIRFAVRLGGIGLGGVRLWNVGLRVVGVCLSCLRVGCLCVIVVWCERVCAGW